VCSNGVSRQVAARDMISEHFVLNTALCEPDMMPRYTGGQTLSKTSESESQM